MGLVADGDLRVMGMTVRTVAWSLQAARVHGGFLGTQKMGSNSFWVSKSISKLKNKNSQRKKSRVSFGTKWNL